MTTLSSLSALKVVPTIALIVGRRLLLLTRSLGIQGTIVYCAKALPELPRRVHLLMDDLLYDSRTRLETSTLVRLEDLGVEPAKMDAANTNASGIAYMPSPARVLRIIAELRLRYNEYTFIDLGSGMGRVVLGAAAFPFRKVVGVEFSPKLHAIAERNLTRASDAVKAETVELICQDAREYTFPPGNRVVYLFNPFREPVLRAVLENLQRAHETNGGELYIIYYRAVFSDVVEDAAPSLIRINTTRDYVIYRSAPTS